MSESPKQPKNLTVDQFVHLIHGYCQLGDVDPSYGRLGYPFRDDEHRRDCWNEAKDFIMSLIGKKHNPYDGTYYGLSLTWRTRPHAWWDYEAKEPRKIVKYEKLMGNHKYPVYEEEFEYLKRNGLLFPGEEEKVKNENTL